MLRKLFGANNISDNQKITDSQGNIILRDIWEDLVEPGMTVVVEARPVESRGNPQPNTYQEPDVRVERQMPVAMPTTERMGRPHSRSSSRNIDMSQMSRPGSRQRTQAPPQLPQIGEIPHIGEKITLPPMQETFGQWTYMLQHSPEFQQEASTSHPQIIAPAPRPPQPAPTQSYPPPPPVPPSRPSSRQSMRRFSPSQPLSRDQSRSRELEEVREVPSSRSAEGIREIHVNPNVEDPPPRPEAERPKSRGNRITRLNSKSNANLRLSKSSIALPAPQKSPDFTKSFNERPRTPPTPPSPISENAAPPIQSISYNQTAPPPPVPAPIPTRSKTNRFTKHIHNFLAKHSSRDTSRTPSPTPPADNSISKYPSPPLENNTSLNSTLSTRRGRFPPPAIMVPPPPPIATVQQPVVQQPPPPVEVQPEYTLQPVPRRMKSTDTLAPPPPDDRSRVGYGHTKSPSLPPLPSVPPQILESEKRSKSLRSTSSRLQLQIKTHQERFISPAEQSATSSALTSSTIGSISTQATTPPTSPNMSRSRSASPPKPSIAIEEKKLPRPPVLFSAFPPAPTQRPVALREDLPNVQMQMRRTQTLQSLPEGRAMNKLGFLGGGGGRTIAVGMI